MLYIFAIALLAVAAHAAANICDTCKCLPGKAAKATSVTCACISPNQNISTTRYNMKGLDHIQTFSASNCNSLVFHTNSFADAHDLKSVTVNHVRHVVYPTGVFTALSVLKIEDVAMLQLEKRAFMGAGGLSEILIRRSTMEELPMHSLFDVHDLRRFELTDVVIKNIRANAINMKMDQGSIFSVNNCTVENIASQAIVLTTNTLQITNSDFDNVSSNAVKATARTRVDINSTHFGGGCNERGLLVRSNDILVNNNTFNVLPIGLLNTYDSASAKIVFSSNYVNNFTLQGIDWNAIQFYNNFVNCDCELAIAGMTFKSLNEYPVDSLYKYTYCKAQCQGEISLNNLVEELNEICSSNEHNQTDVNFLCASQPTTTEAATGIDYAENEDVDADAMFSSSNISGRAGRAGDFGNDETTTIPHEEHTQRAIAKQLVSSSTRSKGLQVQIMAGILWCTFKIFIF